MHPIPTISTLFFFMSACIPSDPKDLIGESDRPVNPGDMFDSEDPADGIDGVLDEGEYGTEMGAPELEATGLETTTVEIEHDSPPTEAIFLYIDDNELLQVEHTLQWDDTDIAEVIISQDATAIEFDYGDPGDLTRWVLVQYAVDITALESGLYTVIAEGDETEFTKP